MEKCFSYFFVLLLCSASTVVASPVTQAHKIQIIVITSDLFPIDVRALPDDTVVQIFNLDAIKNTEKALSQELPKNEKEARKAIEQMIERKGRDQFEQQLIAAYQPFLKAMEFSIDRIPVVIFDGRAVVYGVSDLDDAHARYHSWVNALDTNNE